MGCFCLGRPATAGEGVAKGKPAAGLPDGTVKGQLQPAGDVEPDGELIPAGLPVNASEPAEGAQPIEVPDVPAAELQDEGSGASAVPLLDAEAEAAAEPPEAAGSAAAAGEGSVAGAAHDPVDATSMDDMPADEACSQQSSDAVIHEPSMQEVQDAAAEVSGGSPVSQAAEMELSTEAGNGENGDGGSISLQADSGPEDESSQAALLGEVSLKQPRLSRLSSLLSCASSRVAADSGEVHAQQQAGRATPGQERDFEGAAGQLVLLPRAKLLPLAQPEQALADAAGMLGRQEVPVLLTALLTLRRVAIHHHTLLSDSLEDVVQLLLECLHGSDAGVSQAALMAVLDLFISFGSTMLRHCEGASLPQYSCMLGLLLAASCGRTPAIRFWANEALRYMANRMNQQRVIRLLEGYLQHHQAGVRSKAAEWLMVATYRPPDTATTTTTITAMKQGSPVKWQT